MSKNYKKGPRNGGTPPGGVDQVFEGTERPAEVVKAPITPDEMIKDEVVAEPVPVDEKKSLPEPENAPIESQPEEKVVETTEAPTTATARKKR